MEGDQTKTPAHPTAEVKNGGKEGKALKVLAYGEVLFDVFGTEEKIGGAPFNFAAHMARLGADVELMSAVGQDDRGAQVRGYLQKYRISDRLLAETTFPTGVCRVTLNAQGVPSYELLKPAAWDNIPWTEKAVETKRDLLYFGSLSQREPVSEETLHRVLEKVSSRYRLFDCNIRPPYASREAVRQGLACCTHLKVSREEAPVLTELGVVPTYEDRRRQKWCGAVAEAYGLEQVLLTLDKDGAAVYDGRAICRTVGRAGYGGFHCWSRRQLCGGLYGLFAQRRPHPRFSAQGHTPQQPCHPVPRCAAFCENRNITGRKKA